jgi:hypothetical protein
VRAYLLSAVFLTAFWKANVGIGASLTAMTIWFTRCSKHCRRRQS